MRTEFEHDHPWVRKLALAAVCAAGLFSLLASGGGGPDPAPPANGVQFISLRHEGSDGAEYYAAIGASGDTFSAFRQRNGFDSSEAAFGASAVYFNAGDLNLGRDMHCLPNGPRLACYVSNHAAVGANKTPIFSSYPSAAFAAIDSQAKPFATVAMEGGAAIGPKPFVVRECDGVPTPPRPVGDCGLDAPPPINVGEIRDPATGRDVDTGIDLQPGDIVSVSASGLVYSGVALTGPNGPNGWDNTDNNPKFPLPGGHPFGLIGRVGTGAAFAIGESYQQTYEGAPGRLFLRTNDDSPGNGWGHFDVVIMVRPTVKFFVYDGEGALLTDAELDTEGLKAVPGVCLACHGGHYDAATHTVSGASFLPFNLKSFKYGSAPGQDRASQEEGLRQLNAMVRNTRPTLSGPPDPIADYIEGMYVQGYGTPFTIARDDYVPPGWSGHQDLYLNVVRPYCAGCHLALGPDRDLDFTRFDQLSSRKSRVQALVCSIKTMPHSEVAFDHFWQDAGGWWPFYLTLPETLGLSSCSP